MGRSCNKKVGIVGIWISLLGSPVCGLVSNILLSTGEGSMKKTSPNITTILVIKSRPAGNENLLLRQDYQQIF